MCLRTSTFVVKPMLLISTHWLLWRCDPLDLCSETFRNPEGNLFACRCVASFPLILYSVHRSKAAIFFGAHRRERDGRGEVHSRYSKVRRILVRSAVCLSAAVSLACVDMHQSDRICLFFLLCRGLLRDGGEFDLPVLCVLVC